MVAVCSSLGLDGVTKDSTSLAFLRCMGREEIFHYDLDDLLKDAGIPIWDYGRGVSLPLYHPYRILVNIVMCSYILVVPFAYVAIYIFRLKHDRQVPGFI